MILWDRETRERIVYDERRRAWRTIWSEDSLDEADQRETDEVRNYNWAAHRKFLRLFFAIAAFYAVCLAIQEMR